MSMHSFFAYTNFANPGLHIWREGTSLAFDVQPESPRDESGWIEFRVDLEAAITQSVRFLLFDSVDGGTRRVFESNDHQREFPRLVSGQFPDAVWFAQGSSRVVEDDPRLSTLSSLRLHLISQSRYRPGEMYLWDPVTGVDRRVAQSGVDDLGPIFEVDLQPHEQAFFNFKFIREKDGAFTAFEPDCANRWWVAGDGPDIWMHSGTAKISSEIPSQKRLKVHYRQSLAELATMRLWAENGDYVTDIAGHQADDGWFVFSAELYTHLPYGFLFWNSGLPHEDQWEHPEAIRQHVTITEDAERWTLEGDGTLFQAEPTRTARLSLTVANRDLSELRGDLSAHVWVNHARAPLEDRVPVDADGQVTFETYPDVVTSIKFRDEQGRWENIRRHSISIDNDGASVDRFVVLDRPPLLEHSPPDDLVEDPPFVIRRPGVCHDGDELRFVVHAPSAACAELIGEWTDWLADPVPMKSTRDGTYWWASVPVDDVISGIGGVVDYHGARYQFLFDQRRRLQDPAAGWVERSSEFAASRLVRSDHYFWHDHRWDRPGWESLIIYQIHPARFTNRFSDLPPLRRVAKEIEDHAGYIRELGVTAIQLMPVNEVGSNNSWGYDPAYFYAIENAYCGKGGPDDLKFLVDTCHQHGLAVILDVVFNHAGARHNILWQVARESFFDGDTQWGAMINFDHPQVRHFFDQNLVYLANEFHIDGFRLDHTATIVHSDAWDRWSFHVRELGSGGGWGFLHSLRHAVTTEVGPNCILMAEHLPNEWSMTNFGGSMDSQWCDDFHDRLVDACKREFGMSRLADAFKISHTACDQWYKVTNYAESHDEVGNVRDRVAYVAGYGQGWRMSKVAAAALLMSRGIPLFFMGGESGEDRQFEFGKSDELNLDEYIDNPDRTRIRTWWRELARLRRDPNIQGPSQLDVRLAEDQLLAFTRGRSHEFYVLLNFGGWSGSRLLSSLNLPSGDYLELWNSTWPDFAIRAENEGQHANGGRSARLGRHHHLRIPDYGVVILQKA